MFFDDELEKQEISMIKRHKTVLWAIMFRKMVLHYVGIANCMPFIFFCLKSARIRIANIGCYLTTIAFFQKKIIVKA